MKNPKLFKPILTYSLVVALTASEYMPAFATEMYDTENGADEVVEVIQETAKENVILEEDAVPSLGAQGLPTITQPTISAEWNNGEWVLFDLNYSGTDYEACELSVTVSGTGSVVYAASYYDPDYSIDSENFYDSKTGKYNLAENVTYTFALTPFEYRNVYDEEAEEYYNEKVYGAVKTVRWTAPAIEAVSSLAVKEMTPSGFVFSHSAVSAESSVRYQYSKSATFDEKAADVNSTYSNTLYYSNLEPGEKYYIRAYVYRYGMMGKFSNVVSVTAPVAEADIDKTEIGNTSVTLTLDAGYGEYTGFQIYRKTGSGSYKKLTTTTDSKYADTGLKKDTKYTYKVRAYYYNVDTKKTTYGDYAYKSVVTGGAALNLKAEPSGKTSVKLTWNKVSAASGYDVYRYTGTSTSSTYKSGVNNNFSKYELIKSLGKSKKSFTNKKLTAGESYTYLVKAYKLVKGKKVYFTEASASVTTKFSFSTSVNVYKTVQNTKNGTMKITWKRIPQASGYLIEKKDSATGNWVTQAKITKAKTTSYTLPASPLGKTIEYRIRAYKGSKYSGSATVYVEGCLATVTGVSAKATANGVTVSWKPVAGASFYRVYRTTDSDCSAGQSGHTG